MGADLDGIRQQFLSLISQEDRRIDDPNDWRPYEVNNPAEQGQTFTHESAWELIAQLLANGHPMRKVTQDKPPGAMVYVMIYTLEDGYNLYIKIRLGKKGRHILGRSFHYEEGQF